MPRLPLRRGATLPGTHRAAHRRVPEELAYRQVSELAQGRRGAEEARKRETAADHQ